MPSPFMPPPVPNLPGFEMTDPNSLMANPVVDLPKAKKVGGFSLWDRIQQGVAPYPEQLDGYVDKHDVAGARNQGLLALGASLLESSGPSTMPVGLGQALGRGIQSGMGAYQGALDQLGKRAAVRSEMDMNKFKMEEFKKQQALLDQKTANRQAVLKQFPMPPANDMAAMEQWITSTIPHFVAMGDEDTVRSLTEAYKTIVAQRQGNKSHAYEVDRGDVIELRDPQTNKVLETIKKGISPRDVAAGAETRAEMSEGRRFSKEDNLRGDFNKDTGEYRKTAAKLAGAIGETDRAMAGDGAAQVNMLYAFVNSMDPASAVREGEIGLARAAAGPYDQARGLFDKYLKGESVIIPPALVRSMSELMRRRYDSYRTQVNERIKYYTPQARAYNLDASRLFTGIDELPGARPSLDDLSKGR